MNNYSLIHPKAPYKIPIESILNLLNQGISKSEIAERLGCVPSNITKRLKTIEKTKQYIANKSFMIRHLERRIYDNFTDAKIKKANLQQLSTSYGIIYDKGQLEEGESTQILGYADAIKSRDGVKITLEEIRRVRIERTMQKVSALDSQGFAGDGKNDPLSIDMQPAENIKDTDL
jgi:hypothetical protein